MCSFRAHVAGAALNACVVLWTLTGVRLSLVPFIAASTHFMHRFLRSFFFFLRQTVGKGCCKILRVNVEVKSFFFSHNVAVSIDTRGSEGTGSGMNFI